ncbi:MAG: leucine--tRNA ligase [Candidatus Nealsonbacteria bacterium]|nr:leucine--tRNA ligase [Candidatus Nealsonbacteria bacterium]
MKEYNHKKIEKKWQDFWEKKKFYQAEDFSKKTKKYILIEFPYPSGQGLHVGHCRPYLAIDAVVRKKRMEGFNVLFPIGWDAFGLPAENFAIKTGVHPKITTEKNIANYKRQIKSLGVSFDWSREINTTDPKYYKWTQWIFLQMFNNGLAYQAKIPINWCPACKIGLAHEEVVGGKCERCGKGVEQKEIKQWMLKITKYADRLIEDLKNLDYLEKIKAQQIEWIGKSEGVEVKFQIVDSTLRETQDGAEPIRSTKLQIEVFTTRADTLFGVTAVVLAPEHPFVKNLIKKEFAEKVQEYIKQSREKTEFERTKLEKEKTGVFTGSHCINPANNEEVPIWIGDYVISTYGGGAVMMVPAHDQRDWEFAKKYNLKIKPVVLPKGQSFNPEDLKSYPKEIKNIYEDPFFKLAIDEIMVNKAFCDEGFNINSSNNDINLNFLSTQKAKEKITLWLEEKDLGKKTIKYKLRDWVFSRQHYWGEPIPIIHCEKCGTVPVPEKDLPIELPYIEKYQPTGTGESPLAGIKEWVNVKCPQCGGKARRETDTMPNWAGSNWYYMRYCDPKNNKAIADFKKLKYWFPVDWYNGGMEHTTLHLLYSRFIYKFLFDIGSAPALEPYQKRTSHGMVVAEDNQKMSKSRGNVINPDDIVKQYGADTLRVYEMFMGPFDQAIAWNSKSVNGVFRFLNKVWSLVLECKNNEPLPAASGGVSRCERDKFFQSDLSVRNKKSGKEAIKLVHQLNKKVSEDLENMKFNTAIASFMEFVNFAQENEKEVGKDVIERMLILLAPLAPHVTEELWKEMGNKKSIHLEEWPKYDEKLIQEEKIVLLIQINGKMRDQVEVLPDISEEEAKELALSREKIKKWIEGKEIKKIIFVPKRLINIVI